MAHITLQDGSELELTGEELVLYLKVTGQFVPTKTEAERIAEQMVALRREEVQRAVTESVQQVNHLIETDHEARTREAAIAEGVVVPNPATLPEHLAPTVRPRGPVLLPLSSDEYKVFEALRKIPAGITSKDLGMIMGWTMGKTSGHLSQMFQTERGVYLGTKRRWFMRTWARRAKIRVERYPNNYWPPKEGVPS
jgi:hypothetical protein